MKWSAKYISPTGVITRMRVQELAGDAAEELARELPGLVEVRGGKAHVTNPRKHEKLLEKVMISLRSWTPPWPLQRLQFMCEAITHMALDGCWKTLY